MTNMTPTFFLQSHRTARMVAHLFACLALTTVSGFAAADPDQSRLAPPPGDGWQILLAAPARSARAQLAMAATAAPVILSAPVAAVAAPARLRAATSGSGASSGCRVLAGADTGCKVPGRRDGGGPVFKGANWRSGGRVLRFTITPQDINLAQRARPLAAATGLAARLEDRR